MYIQMNKFPLEMYNCEFFLNVIYFLLIFVPRIRFRFSSPNFHFVVVPIVIYSCEICQFSFYFR